MRRFVKLFGSACLLGTFLASPMALGQATVTQKWDFDTEPTDLIISGNNDTPWLPEGGNPDSGGFMAMTYSEGSQNVTVLFPDPSEGQGDNEIIKSFTFT